MARVSRRTVGLFLALALVTVGVGSALAATAMRDSVHITVAPKTGKYGSKYNVSVKAKATASGEELALSMTSAPGSCPTDYSAGFASLAGLANAKGKPIAPKYVYGNVKENVHAKMTISTPGTYGICAYLVVGSTTKAHAASHFTITQ
jgi:hypothetical protein